MDDRPSDGGVRGTEPPGYALPEALRLGPVHLQVADLNRSLAYYQDVLGLRTLERGDGSAALGTHDDGVPLLRLRERKGAAPLPYRGHLGLYHFALRVPDRRSLADLLAHLRSIHARVGASDHLVSEALYLYDPDGLGIEVYADTPAGTWRREGGQIVMRTGPLDLDDLLRDAAGPWLGLPGGTVMGHVHLHVGDLGEAEAFYHRALGLDKTVWSYPGVLFFAGRGYHHHVGTNLWAESSTLPDPDGARLVEWEMVLPAAADAEAAARSVAAAGYRAVREGDGWRVADPWGIELRLRAGDGD